MPDADVKQTIEVGKRLKSVGHSGFWGAILAQLRGINVSKQEEFNGFTYSLKVFAASDAVVFHNPALGCCRAVGQSSKGNDQCARRETL
jgi:hypothetical protein